MSTRSGEEDAGSGDTTVVESGTEEEQVPNTTVNCGTRSGKRGRGYTRASSSGRATTRSSSSGRVATRSSSGGIANVGRSSRGRTNNRGRARGRPAGETPTPADARKKQRRVDRTYVKKRGRNEATNDPMGDLPSPPRAVTSDEED